MKKIFQLVGIVVGIAIIIMGASLCSSAESGAYIGTTYAVDYSFGADFYTQMFSVTYDILSQLNSMATGITSNFTRALHALSKGFGMLTIAIGMVTTVSFAYLFFSDLSTKTVKEVGEKGGRQIIALGKKGGAHAKELLSKATAKPVAAPANAPAHAAEPAPEAPVAAEAPQTPVAKPANPKLSSATAAMLADLEQLHIIGALTDEEFEQKKKELLTKI